MKIHNLIAENVKKIKFVDITPDGAIVEIKGANDTGKSSVLDSIYWALAGAGVLEPMPIRRGEESARIQLDLGEIIVTRKFTSDGKTALQVESVDGDIFKSPQQLLDKMMGTLTFDPLAFANMAPVEQLRTLRSIVTLDENVDALAVEHKRLYDQRALTNREVKRLEGKVGPRPAGPDRPEVSVVELHEELERRRRHNQEAGRLEAERVQRSNFIDSRRRLVAEMRERIARLQLELNNEEAILEQARGEFENLRGPIQPLDESEILLRIGTAEQDNRLIVGQKNALAMWELDAADLAKVRESSDADTLAMQKIQERRAAAFSRAKMPIEGLAFTDGEVLFNHVPLQQASSAQQIKVSLRIAMALNPKLKILRVKNGSLLDEKNLALIAEMVELEGYQLWIERVDTSGGVGVIMEDGEVVNAIAR